jgi:hypothetical protein
LWTRVPLPFYRIQRGNVSVFLPDPIVIAVEAAAAAAAVVVVVVVTTTTKTAPTTGFARKY